MLFHTLLYLFLIVTLAQLLLRKGWFYRTVLERARKGNPALDERKFRAWQLALGSLLLAFLALRDLGVFGP